MFLRTTPRSRGLSRRWECRDIGSLPPSPPPLLQLSVVSGQFGQRRNKAPTTGNWQLATRPQPLATPFVGREHELAQLQAWYARVQQGERQIVFVSGEAGIGKTTLVEAFLQRLESRVQSLESEDQKPLLSKVRTLNPRPQTLDARVRIGHGHCVEQTGPGEVYLPVLQALQQLCNAPYGDQVVAILRRYAPRWLLQLSGVIEADERERLQRQVQGATPQRLFHEFTQAIEQLTAKTALILFFEDLQWSDGLTLELLAYLAQFQEQARLLVIGTYRPADTVSLRPHLL
jgi:GTPase SAR1 family protein